MSELDLTAYRQALADIAAHDHGSLADLHCLNVKAWLGDQVPALLAEIDARRAELATAFGNHRNGLHAQPHDPDLEHCLACMVELAEFGQSNHQAEVLRLRAEKQWLLGSISPALRAEFRLCAQTSEVANAEEPNYTELLKELHGHMFTADCVVYNHPGCEACGDTVPPVGEPEMARLRARIAELESRPISAPPTPPGGRGGLRPEDIHGRNEVQLAGDLAVHDAHVGGDHAACDASWCGYATRSAPVAEAGIEAES